LDAGSDCGAWWMQARFWHLGPIFAAFGAAMLGAFAYFARGIGPAFAAVLPEGIIRQLFGDLGERTASRALQRCLGQGGGADTGRSDELIGLDRAHDRLPRSIPGLNQEPSARLAGGLSWMRQA